MKTTKHFRPASSHVLRTLISVSAIVLSILTPAAHAANRVWLSTPADGLWSTAGNWDIGTAVVATDTLVFTNSSITSVTNDSLAANSSINAFTFPVGADAFTIWGNSIALNGNITNASANGQVFNLDTLINGDRLITGAGNVTFGGLTLNNAGNRALYQRLAGGTLFLNNVTLSEAAGTARTLTIAGGASGSAAQANTIISGVVANGSTASSTLAFFGTGTLKFNGSFPSTHGISSVTAGTLLVDFVNLSSGVNLLDPASTLTLGGGTYSILGKSSGSTFQTNGNLALTAGTGSGITLNNNAGAGTTLRLGNLGGRGGNSTLFIDTSAGGTLLVGSAPAVANGILNPAYATMKDGSGLGFAAVSGNAIVRYTGASSLTDNANNPLINFSYAADGSTFNWNNGVTSRGANSLAIDTSAAGGALDLGGAANVLTNSSRAILMTGNNNFTIQNGQVGSSGVEQIVHVAGPGVLTISGTVGANTASLTKGGAGTLILSGANTYSNGTFVTEGTLKLGAANVLGSSDRTLGVSAGGVVDLNGFNLNVGVLNGNGGGIIVNNGASPATLSIGNGNVANSGTTIYTIADGASAIALLKVGTGQLQLSGASSFTGGTTISGGNANALRLNNSLGMGLGSVTLNDGGIFTTSNPNPLAGGQGQVIANNFIIASSSANNVIQEDGNGFTFTGNFTGSGNVKVHAGTRVNFNANFNGDFSGYNGTFEVAPGAGASTFQARLSQNGGSTMKVNLSTAGAQLAFSGGTPTNVALGEISGIAGTALTSLNASKTITIGALGTSTAFGGSINEGTGGAIPTSVTKVGAGTLTIGGVSTYTGSTVVSNGILFANGLSSTNVSVFAPGGFGAVGSVAGPVILNSGNAGLLLTNGATGSLTVGDGVNGLTLENGNHLAFDVGANPVSDFVLVNGAFTQSGTATVYIGQAAGFGAGVFTLLTAIGGGVNSANFALGNSIPGYVLSLSSDGNNLFLTVTVSAPATAFWHNRSGTTWNTANNWDTDEFSGIALSSPPSSPTDVTFASSAANNFTTTLGANIGIHHLDFKTTSAVSVGGANTLTINGNLSVQSGAGNPSITASGLALGVDQTWTITDVAQTLSVGSPVSGGKALTIAGAGTVSLSGNNSYSGGTFISGTATLALANAADTLANSGAVTVDGGTLNIGANNDIVGLVGLTNGAIIGTSGILTGSVYVVENGIVSARLGGNGALNKLSGGIVVLSGNNSYSGGTLVANGILQLSNSTALGTGNATVASGASIDLNGQATANITSVVGIGLGGMGAIFNSSLNPAAINSEIGNGSSYSVNATGDITIQRTRSGGGAFTVTKDGPGTLTLGTLAATSHNNLMGLVINGGAVVLNMPGFLAVDRDPVTINSSSILRLAGTGNNQIQDDRTITINDGTFDMNGRSENIGHLNGSPAGIITNSAVSTTGTLSVGPGNLAADGSGQYDGIIVGGAGEVAISKSGSGNMILTGINTYTGSTTISGGSLTLNEPGSIGNSALINIGAGAILDVTGRSDQTLTLNSGQTLMGNGTVNGMLTTSSGSTVNPGASVGTLHVANNVTLGGKLLLELNRTNAPNHDVLISDLGTITYGGTLTVTNIGEALQVNDTFQLFPSAVTAFGSITIATTDATGAVYTWTNKVAVDGSITVLTVVPPVSTTPPTITYSVSGDTLNLSWPPDHKGWRLLTNAVGLLATNSWFQYPSSNGSADVTNVSLTIDRTRTNLYFRLIYP